MNDTLDLPPIDTTPIAAAASTALAPLDFEKLDLATLAVAKFGDWRGDVAKARNTLDGAVHDLSTQAKVDEAKSLRFRLIGQPRADARKVSKALKSKLAAVSKTVGAEEDAAVAAYDAAETLITPQIEAREAELTAEKIERERIAAERAQKQADGVANIRAYLSRAQTAADMTAERVGKGIVLLEGVTFSADEWLDPVAAASAQCETLEGMRVLQATLQAREEAAAAAEAKRLENERVAAELAAAQAKLQAEQQRIASLKARIAEIQAAATGREKATAADLYEAMVAVTALDVSEAQYQEFTPLAEAAQDATLAALQSLHMQAVEREEIKAARIAQMLAEAAAMPDLPTERVGEIIRSLHNRQPSDKTPEFTEGQDDQQVLKAEPATADATDRSVPADISPCGGTMGAGQPAAAGPAGDEFVLVVPPESTMYTQLSATAAVGLGVTLIRGEVGTIDAGITIGEPPAMTHAAFLALVMTAFECKFPSHPKPSQEWWAKVRAAGQALQGLN